MLCLIELRQAFTSYQDHRMCHADRAETGPYFVPGSPHAFAHSRPQAVCGMMEGANLSGDLKDPAWPVPL